MARRGTLCMLLLGTLLALGACGAHGRKLLQSTPAATFCAGKAAGNYADTAGGCAGFFICYPGGAVYQRCGPGTLFSPATKVCDYPANVKCGSGGGSTTPTTAPTKALTPTPTAAPTKAPTPTAAPPAGGLSNILSASLFSQLFPNIGNCRPELCDE